MKHLAWAFFVILGMCMPVSASPVYRAGQTSSGLSSLLHGELSADYQFSSQKMETVTGEGLSTSALKGWNVRALWTPLNWFSVGAEMTRFGDERMKEAFVQSYETNRVAGLVKLTLSPNTSPRVYVLGGYGRTEHTLKYEHSSIITRTWPNQDKKTTSYWMAGVGLEVDVWRMLFVGVEGDVLRHQSTVLKRFYKTDAKTETMLRVRAGVRF